MSQNFIVTGNIQFAPAADAPNATVPIGLSIPYTQLHLDQLVYVAPVTNAAVILGTMTTPKAVYLECLSGSCTLKLAGGDTGVISLGLTASPGTTDRSLFLFTNPSGAALTLFVSVTAAATLKVIAVQ